MLYLLVSSVRRQSALSRSSEALPRQPPHTTPRYAARNTPRAPGRSWPASQRQGWRAPPPPTPIVLSESLPVLPGPSLLPQSRCEIDDRVKHHPDRRHPIPVDRDRDDIDAVFHVVLAREDPDSEQHCFSSQDAQMHHVHPEHEPDDRTVRVTVPAKVHGRELEPTQHDRTRSTQHCDNETDLRHTSVAATRRDVSQHHRNTTHEEQDCVRSS